MNANDDKPLQLEYHRVQPKSNKKLNRLGWPPTKCFGMGFLLGMLLVAVGVALGYAIQNEIIVGAYVGISVLATFIVGLKLKDDYLFAGAILGAVMTPIICGVLIFGVIEIFRRY